jgi:hypothetical protein
VSFSCHHPPAALQKGRQCFPQPHFNGWQVMDSFVRPSVEMTKVNGVPKCHQGRTLHSAVRVLWKSCMSHSSAEMYLGLTIPCQLIWWSMANIAAHSCRVRWGHQFTANNQNCWSMVSFAPGQCNTSSRSQCANLCSVGAERCWHILPTFQTLPHVMTDCLHMWQNIFGGNCVNQKTISTLLSLPLYIVWARMNIQLQLITYHIDGKSMWTVLVITLRRGRVYKHSGISEVLSCILYYNKIIRRTSEMAHICMCVYVHTYLCVHM